ncbi:glycoside hydrolase family 3 C-terminal domain-containing protein [Herbiconiux solani]|uniref:glycoside hydrolase family 3 C-terminal domain-containing protein n=1 Tax=Herbiconiux solani TaxID=661329 RepID=UPI000825120C|nr:glycoside hydrolase family 3 C-terminal domain-containing protein [Herbiconiux solani]
MTGIRPDAPATAPAAGDLIARLTDDEKVALTAGADAWTTVAVERLGIPALRLGDGPHGVRRPHDGSGMSMFASHPATCFPTASALGASWDPALVREVGVALGREAAGHGIGVLLGPGVNLKRTPVGGRDFEYFSEDPLVSGELGAAWVEGVQSVGVGASLKHLAANNTEQRRYGVESVVDDRALRELYLAAFEHVVRRARPATVMAAYNRLNGWHCTENAALLNGILREEWGFEGVVLSDWGASWDRCASIPAGTDLTMPGLGRGDDAYVRAALRSGALGRDDLDRAVARILTLLDEHRGIADGGPAPDLDAHHALARRAATAGTVLLKNEGGLLPLAAGSGIRVAVIGAFADEPRFQGAGSSHVVPTRVDTLLDALTDALPARADGTAVLYAPGYDRATSRSTAAQLAEAEETAAVADVAVVVVGLPETYETEGVDRSHLRLPPAHDRLVRAVRAMNPQTIVVLQNGAPVELPWRDEVPVVLEAYLGGQASGGALADVLLGIAEPGGRLAETFPVRYSDHPVAGMPNGPATVEYRESLYVGYRWSDSVGAEVAFPFGHGLSYTRFDCSEVDVEAAEEGAELDVSLVVTNSGSRRGSEVVQVYLHQDAPSVFRPEHELRAFAKVELEPGESAPVRLRVDERAFRVWDAGRGAWRPEPGRYEVRVGRSSRDILYRAEVDIPGAEPTEAPTGAPRIDAYDHPSATTRDPFPAADFARLLGRAAPPNVAARPGSFTLDTAVRDMQGALVGRLLFRLLRAVAVKTIGAPPGAGVDRVAGEVVAQLAFRMFPTVTEGAVGRRGTRLLLRLVNLLSGPGRYHGRSRDEEPPAPRSEGLHG